MRWYEKALQVYERRGETGSAAKCYLSLGNLCLAKVVGQRRDFASAKKWFGKALECDDNATWRDRLTLYGRVWRYRLLSVFSK
jgi:TPR repeat protein